MLRQNVIEPSASPWASNIVLARKNDGSYRCCIDFRQLNTLTRKDAYPLPRTEACFDALAGSCLFSTFDLRSGYHQVALDTNDADKTAFITRRGTFRFRTMPFGLCNAVASFQRLMDLVLAGLNLETCLAYLDDVIVFSRNEEEHLQRLECLFQRLKTHNLKLKPSKCSLLQTKVSFLGHVVGREGIATDPDKIKLIKDWPEPKNLRELRGFLGLAGYYRRFVEGFSNIACPLTALMKKGRVFSWTDECRVAFEQLKERLQEPPILTLPNQEDPFILDTDAAENSIGAVLSQVQNGQERVVAYAGKTLSPQERNYCITRRELLAVVTFLKHFRQYLLGAKFVVRTDHSALTWLKRTPEPIGQNARWLATMEEYSFEVRHRPGARHANADAISRHPCLNRPSCKACHPAVAACAVVTAETITDHDVQPTPLRTFVLRDGPADQPTIGQSEKELPPSDVGTDQFPWTKTELIKLQREDPDVSPIVKLREQSNQSPEWREVEGHSSVTKALWYEFPRLELKDGLLCRRWTSANTHQTSHQIVLPSGVRQQLIRAVHAGLAGGHLGRSKTEAQVQRRYYWPAWRADVAREVQRCSECAKYHRGSAPRQTPLTPFCSGEPFEVLSVDVTGPHPKSSKGNEYIITMCDLFSKWAEAVPVRNHTASVVAQAIMDRIICKFGAPRRILSDQGREFESALFQELCVKLEIDKVRTSPYQPSTNGAVERFHRTLNSMLAKTITENQRDWDVKLEPVMAAYRAAVHSATGFSPNYLVLGRENRMPVDVVLGPISEEQEIGSTQTYDDFVDRTLQVYTDAYRLAREHLGVAAEKRKEHYDIRVKRKEFAVGDWVYYYYPRRYKQKSPKWTKNYDGPYLIIKRIEPSDYVIQKTKRSAPIVTHGNKLKKCHGEAPESWLKNGEDHQEVVMNDEPLGPLTQPSDHHEPATPIPVVVNRKKVQRRREHEALERVVDEAIQKRTRKAPGWFRDYEL